MDPSCLLASTARLKCLLKYPPTIAFIIPSLRITTAPSSSGIGARQTVFFSLSVSVTGIESPSLNILMNSFNEFKLDLWLKPYFQYAQASAMFFNPSISTVPVISSAQDTDISGSFPLFIVIFSIFTKNGRPDS